MQGGRSATDRTRISFRVSRSRESLPQCLVDIGSRRNRAGGTSPAPALAHSPSATGERLGHTPPPRLPGEVPRGCLPAACRLHPLGLLTLPHTTKYTQWTYTWTTPLVYTAVAIPPHPHPTPPLSFTDASAWFQVTLVPPFRPARRPHCTPFLWIILHERLVTRASMSLIGRRTNHPLLFALNFYSWGGGGEIKAGKTARRKEIDR